MKKFARVCLFLVYAAFPFTVCSASVPGQAQRVSEPGERDGRLCMELKDLGGGPGDSDDSLELPPLRMEPKGALPAESGPLLKSLPAAGGEVRGGRRGDPGPDEPASRGFSPLIFSTPDERRSPEKLQAAPIAPAGRQGARGTGTPGSGLPTDLKAPASADTAVRGRQGSPAWRQDAGGTAVAPELPLLGAEVGGAPGQGAPSSRAPLILKPSAGPSPPEAGGIGRIFSSGPSAAGGTPFGSELDEKLNAIYEKHYKKRN